MELRRRNQWDQRQLAKVIHHYRWGAGLIPSPHQVTVSRWECGANLPSIPHRIALAKIAAARRESALEVTLIAPLESWHFLTAVFEVGIAIDPETGGGQAHSVISSR
jgi:hypothetical protein